MIRFISLVAKVVPVLFVGLFCIFSIGHSAASSPKKIIGADINRLIADTMSAKGMTGSPRLSRSRKFLACQSGMSVKPMFGTWKTVKVSCEDIGGWTVMVRTNLKSVIKKARKPQRADVTSKKLAIGTNRADLPSQRIVKAKGTNLKNKQQKEMMNILALGRSMSRGDVIMPRDIIIISVPINAASGVFFDAEDVIGRKLKTSVTAKKPIQARHLKPKWLVEEDDEVLIQNQSGGIRVDMVGLALENGQFGEWIKVQNVRSGIIISGQIKNKKIISVNPKISRELVVD